MRLCEEHSSGIETAKGENVTNSKNPRPRFLRWIGESGDLFDRDGNELMQKGK